MAMSDWSAEARFLQFDVEAALQSFPWGRPAFERVLAAGAGSDEYGAGDDLILAAHNQHRGLIAYWLYLRLRAGECSVVLYRAAFDSTWNHDHNWLLSDMSRHGLRDMFCWAAFPIPAEIPAMVDIWRGVSGQRSVRQVARGLSWTIDRDMACWFAMRFTSPKRKPMVLKATMPRDALFYPYNERDEYEVVCFDAGAAAAIDGGPEDWAAGAERVMQEHTASLEELKASFAQAAAEG
jgi:hypothetical protein